MDSIIYKSANSLVRMQQENQINAKEILCEYKNRTNQVNPSINALISTNWEQAEALARDADDYFQNHKKLIGPLHGIPFTCKDMMDVVGFNTTLGSNLYNHTPKKDSEFVTQLKNAGAIPMGKTNLPEFAGALYTDNERFGRTNNPYNLKTSPGGSSGGSAAAVAAGLTSFDMGTDGGSSIRVPAHFCGVYGHKPSFDLVSFSGVFPPGDAIDFGSFMPPGDLAVIGPLARYAGDLEVIMRILAKQRGYLNDAYTFKLPEPKQLELKDFTVGVWLEHPDFPLDDEVSRKLEEAVKVAEKAGCKIIIKKPRVNLNQLIELYVVLLGSLAFAGPHRDALLKKDQIVSPESDPGNSYNKMAWKAAHLTHAEWVMYDGMRTLMRKILYEYFQEVDVLLTPSAPITAFDHHDLSTKSHWVEIKNKKMIYGESIWAWMSIPGLSNAPATTAPVGLTKQGMPVGVQIVGQYLNDLTTIRFSELLAHEIGGFVAPKL